MESSTARIALAVDDRRLDLVVPAHRPVGEYLARVVAIVAAPDPGDAGWRLLRVGGELLPGHRSLADCGVLDGELLVLAPGLMAPSHGDQRLDDLRAAVAERVDHRRATSTGRRIAGHALAAAATVVVAASLFAGGAAGAAVAGALAVGMLVAAATRRRTDDVVASIWALAALAPASTAGAALDLPVASSPWSTTVAAVAIVAAIGAAVVPARGGVLVPLAAGALVGAGSISALVAVDVSATLAAPLVLVGLAIVEVSPRLGFVLLRAGGAELDGRMRRSRRVIVAGRVGGSVALVCGAVALARTDDPWGWWLVGLAAAVLTLHTCRDEHTGDIVPLAAGALLAVTALDLAVLLPEHGWVLAAGAAAAAGLAVAGAVAAPIGALGRRRISRFEALVVVPTAVAALVASGALDALFRAGLRLS